MWGKRNSTLMNQICTPENLHDAWRRVRGNIRVRDRPSSRGADGISIADFERDLETNLARLEKELREGRYRPQPVNWFSLPKRSGGARIISVLAVSDRVAQRAVQNVIEPLFEAQFLDCSYGFRPGRSVADAIARLVAYRQAGYTWVLDADIQDCFARLDHGLLMRCVRPVVREAVVWRLIQAWLDAGVMETLTGEKGGSRAAAGSGLLDVAAYHLEAALDWGLRQLAGQEEPWLYDADLPPVEGNQPLDREAIRRRALGRLGREGLVLGLSFSRPLLDRARQSLPEVGQTLRRRNVAVAALASLGVALLPFVYKTLTDQDETPGGVGAPQGAVLSPLLANAYLHPFDQAMTRRGFALVRYADDWCIVGHSQAEVERARQAAVQVLGRLKLALNEDKSRILPLDEGFAFLGARLEDDGSPASRPDGRWQRFTAGSRRTVGRARQAGGRAVGALRRQGDQLADNARRTAQGIADDLRRVRLFGDAESLEKTEGETNDGYIVPHGTGHDPE